MRLVPIRYSDDVEASVRFYTALGLDRSSVSRPGGWVELVAPAGMLAIHEDGSQAGDCELAFEAQEPLEDVVARLVAARFAPEPILDENFGRSVRVPTRTGCGCRSTNSTVNCIPEQRRPGLLALASSVVALGAAVHHRAKVPAPLLLFITVHAFSHPTCLAAAE